MKLERLALVALLALSGVACAADRNRDLKTAEANLTSAQMEARNEESRVYEKQAREQIRAQHKGLTPKEQAELQTKQADERAKTTAEGEKNIADANEDVADAQAAMATERAKVATDARERLTKVDAKVAEVNRRSGEIATNKRAKYTSEMNTYKAKKAEVQEQLANLPKTTNDAWNETKTKLDKNLDALEAVTDRLDDLL